MRDSTYVRGFEAEKIVALYMVQKGYELLKHRFKTKYGEIDLVMYCYEKKEIVFIEVKLCERYCRSHKNEPLPELLSRKQQKRNCEAAIYFLSNYPEYAAYAGRFDLIVVAGGKIISHIEDAWQITEEMS